MARTTPRSGGRSLRFVMAAVLAIFLSACPAKDPDVLRLKQMDDAKGKAGYAAFCDMSIQCGSSDPHVCSRIHAHVGGACLARADAQSGTAPAAEMRQVTSDAETAFRAALAKAADDSERLTAQRGAAEALELRRPFSSDAAPINTAIEALANQLDAVPGGAPYSGYYRAGVKENRIVSRPPSVEQCPEIDDALTQLSGTTLDNILMQSAGQRLTPQEEARNEALAKIFIQRAEQRRARLNEALTRRSCP